MIPTIMWGVGMGASPSDQVTTAGAGQLPLVGVGR